MAPKGAAYLRASTCKSFFAVLQQRAKTPPGWELGTRASYLPAFRPFLATQSAGQAGARYMATSKEERGRAVVHVCR